MSTMVKEVKKAYQLSVDAVVDRLDTSTETGLSSGEARHRLSQYGRNELERKREKPVWYLLVEQFLSPLMGVLVVAAGLAFFFQDYLEAVAILFVIVINAVIGFSMEWQARRSMEALRRLSESMATVIRDGATRRLPSAELAPGDLILLEAGDVVPADCRIVQEEQLGVKEAALTGESTQVGKQVEQLTGELPIHDRSNLLFKGTVVSRGNARAIVFATGADTELGAIAHLVQRAEKEATPLERKLRVLSQRLLWITLFLTLLLLLIGVFQGRDTYLMLKTAIALAIAAIPEGLPIVATIALARGMLRLARHRVVVKKLSAVETLGETQVIFTDKTGTLTENRLSVDTLLFDFDRANAALGGDRLQLAGQQEARLAESETFRRLCEVAVLCNNAVLPGEGQTPIGDPLEVALLRLANAAGFPVQPLRDRFPRRQELPFDSDTKMMGTLHAFPDRPGYLVCVKGALEVLLPLSVSVLSKDGPRKLDNPEYWLQEANALAAQGLRTLALAYRETEQTENAFSGQLVLVGLIGFLDPPRMEVRDALETCRRAGINVVMVTGDHPATAAHIAYRTGLVDRREPAVLQGEDLQRSLAGADREKLLHTRVFARVSPAQKLELVKHYQEQELTVGMTGDGINDTPALRKADIGIAMGRRGTEAAKEVADLVLEDDAFTSIVLAIRQGRGIFDNIRYFVIYLLSCNLGELLVVAIAALANWGVALLPLQILFLNMVTDVFPALALGMNREAAGVMERPPRPSNTRIIDRRSWRAIGLYAAGLTVGTLGALFYARNILHTTDLMANNITFYTIIMAQLWHVFNLPEKPWRNEVTSNLYIWLALLLCLLITVVAYTVPVISTVLQLQPMTWSLLGLAFLFSLIPVLLVQLCKFFRLV